MIATDIPEGVVNRAQGQSPHAELPALPGGPKSRGPPAPSLRDHRVRGSS